MANPLEDMLKQLQAQTGQQERQLAPELQDTLIGRPIEDLEFNTPEVKEAPANEIVENPYTEESPQSLEQELYGSEGVDPILDNAFQTAEAAETAGPSRQEVLLEELRRIRGDSREEMQKAREEENRAKMIAGLGGSLAQYMSGDLQSDSGANIRVPEYRGVDPSSIDMTSDVQQRRKEDLEAALQEFKLLAPSRDIKQIGNKLVEMTEDGPKEIYSGESKGLSQFQQARLEEMRKNRELREKLLTDRKKGRERKVTNDQIKAARDFLKDDPRYKKTIEQGSTFEEVGNLISAVSEEKNEAALAALGTKLARAMGEVGVLTDADVVRYLGTRSWGRNILAWYDGGMEGTLPEESINELKNNINVFEGKVKEDLKEIYSNARTRLVDTMGVDEDKAKQLTGRIPIVERDGQKEKPKFPMEVRKDGQIATVSNEEELKEAQDEGWK